MAGLLPILTRSILPGRIPARFLSRPSKNCARIMKSTSPSRALVPGRGVSTEKPQEGSPRKKYRAVICGNYQAPHPDRAKETLHACGADSVSLRTCLRWAGLREAGASVVDVKTAFLNAPVDASESKYLICNPPRHMVLAGVVPVRTRWRVHGALCGPLTSPRAWSKERDGRVRKFQRYCLGAGRRLLQCITDPNVGRLVDDNDQVLGLVTCYVDDLLVLGSRPEREAFLGVISGPPGTQAIHLTRKRPRPAVVDLSWFRQVKACLHHNPGTFVSSSLGIQKSLHRQIRPVHHGERPSMTLSLEMRFSIPAV